MVLGAIFVRRFVKATAMTHVAFTGVSVLFGILGPKGTAVGDEDDDTGTTAISLNQSPDAFLRKGLDLLIQDMYSGRGIDPQYQFEQKNLISLDNDVSFEDALAVCVGPQEVTEAFRALKAIRPESLSPPECIQLDRTGKQWVVAYALHQRYAGRLSLNSVLVVHATVGDLTEDERHAVVKVKRIQERWFGVEPVGGIYWPSRRLNGILSYALTALLV